MDAMHFDRLARSLTDASSRRRLLSGLAATLGLASIRVPGYVEARNKRNKNKNKKLKTNAFGCVNVGGKCRGNNGNCCSGICQGKKPKQGKKDRSTCIAHNTGECQVGQDLCLGNQVECGESASDVCARTTGDAPFCAKGLVGVCTECSRDGECAALFGAGAACIICPLACAETITGCFAAGA